MSTNAFSNCTSGWVGCNNIFYIKDGKVIEYAPTGRCYTNETVQPQERYKRLKAARLELAVGLTLSLKPTATGKPVSAA